MTPRSLDGVLPGAAAQLLRDDPVLMLQGAERQGLERWELDALSRPIAEAPADLTPPAMAAIGVMGALADSYDHVVTGVCLGSARETKLRWLAGGPPVDVVCSLDLAAEVAARVGARLHVWVPDQEYACTSAARARPESQQEACRLEYDVGAAVVSFVYARYPRAQVHRTGDPAVRGELHARMAAPDVAARYPRGVQTPYGLRSTSPWWHLHFMMVVGSMLVESGRVLEVIDHDQVRACVAAHALDARVSALLFTPVPQLGWTPPRGASASAWVSAMHEAPRRMSRAAPSMQLHLDEALPMPLGWSPQSAREVAWHLTGDPDWLADGDRVPDLDACRRIRDGWSARR